MVLPHKTEELVSILAPPLLKEIIEQQRLILEMHKLLIPLLSKPPVIFKTKDD